MDNSQRSANFLEELRVLMLKHGVSSIMTGHEGAIYCNDNYFSADEALIIFNESRE